MRLDKELVEKSLVPSRSKAQELIKEGFVLVNGKVIDKANYLVKETDLIDIKDNDKLKYVSRGGLKLDKAINEFNIDMTNKNVMDIGSSTGGFSDCALQYGASHIVAVDVGTNLMHESLRNNPKIDLHEQTNFKEFESPYFKNIDIAVCDVSFISLKRIIDKIASENVSIDMVCLIKPQFECGKEIADKYKGIILNKQIHIDIIKDMINYFNEKGFYVKNLTSSPIRGGDGNIEYLTLISNKIDSNKEINIEDLVYNTFKNR
jgi:23S rRNA (cytidine1920-2'-O)/16S rRNA (cytidine1409-2'-O)-methyltransferase